MACVMPVFEAVYTHIGLYSKNDKGRAITFFWVSDMGEVDKTLKAMEIFKF